MMSFSIPLLILITVIIVVFNCVGLFGNINVIIASLRKPSLRSKAGCLMAILCCFQSICLLSEVGNVYIYWSQTIMNEAVCFRMIYPYVFCMIAQSVMYFMIALDMLTAISAPLKHKMWPKITYVSLMCLPPLVIAFAACVSYYSHVDRGALKMCQPPTAMGRDVVMFFFLLLFSANTATVIMIFSVAVIVNRAEKKMSGSKQRRSTSSASFYLNSKLIRALLIMVSVFACSWYLCVVIVYAALWLKLEEDKKDHIMTLNMTLAFIAYSQNYYVLRFRSPQYRAAFAEQLQWMKRCKILHLCSKDTDLEDDTENSPGRTATKKPATASEM